MIIRWLILIPTINILWSACVDIFWSWSVFLCSFCTWNEIATLRLRLTTLYVFKSRVVNSRPACLEDYYTESREYLFIYMYLLTGRSPNEETERIKEKRGFLILDIVIVDIWQFVESFILDYLHHILRPTCG